ncbi:MAG: hypothetical protein RBT59_10455 [Arcobacteraceae bacterium]|nr:hypothetical protein [Arcobacteraceae bacterium]
MNDLYYSLDEEEYHDIDYIAEQLKEDKERLTVFVGEAIKPTHKQFIVAIDICEEMQNKAYDEFDEYSEGYLVEITKEQEEELNNLIAIWFNQNAKEPNFYRIENAKQITREEFFKEHYGENDEQ